MTDAVRQSYISRFNKMEAEYQKAGTEGAFKAGGEGDKLIFDIAGTFAGGVGIAKGGGSGRESFSKNGGTIWEKNMGGMVISLMSSKYLMEK
ncbi:hypothetical protein [Moellerella wisconsensis]|uniref:hypothetical protein n=1 Tax=Moellerella wisconsensis TaxID=158849 RepID=UPI001F4D6568|nr:hypothetical protein [Moellerella wisconsensis]UNH23519.1 hypothetical protein MNY68_11935 [Moellerella wisconsensis]